MLNEIFAHDMIVHVGTGRLNGAEEVASILRNTLKAFPEMKHTIDDMFSVGGKTAVHWRGEGIYKDEFAGLPASGKKLE